MGPDLHARGLHLLVDVPNLTNSLRDLACKREGSFIDFDTTRLSLRTVYRLAHADRPVAEPVGWGRPTLAAMAARRDTGIRARRRDRPARARPRQ